MEMMLLPLFEDIFSNEKHPVSLAELLKDVPTDAVIRVCCHLNAMLHHGGNNFAKQEDALKAMISRTVDDGLRNYYWDNWKRFKSKNSGQQLGVFPLTHTMQLIQESLFHYVPGTADRVTEQQELNILRALLLVNNQANERLSKNVDANFYKQDTDKVYGILWSSLLIHSTLFLRKEFAVTLFKSFHFYEYLKKNYPLYLEIYLGLNGTKNYQEIIIELITFYFNAYNKEQNLFGSFFPASIVPKSKAIQELILDVAKFDREQFLANQLDKNFKGFRSFPLLLQENKNIAVPNWDFLTDKFYDGLVFDFYNKSGISQEAGFKTLGDYKSKLGEGFANALFMETMKTIFSGHGNIALAEKERNKECDYDFYIRIENHVFIFEFKDILFPIKETYEEIKKVVDEKLVDGKKGVAQLVRHITRMANNPEIFDDFGSYKLKDLIIHPIIVYTDSAYGITGINSYLNEAFAHKIGQKERESFAEIRSLGLVHWDFFLQRFDHFKKRDIILSRMADDVKNLMLQRSETQRNHPSISNYLRTMDGYDIPAEESVPIKTAELLNGTLYNYIFEQLRPYLPS